MALIPVSMGGGGGSGSDDCTATQAQVLTGYTAIVSGSDDEPVSGTMTNNGAVSQSLNAGGSYTIPAGYHNGSGKVTANSLSSQTSGTAAAAQILSGYTAWVNGSQITGSMTNRGAVTQTLDAGGSYTIPAGYHNGSGKVTANSLSSQTSGTAAAAQILSGYTAWVNGSKVTGSISSMSGSTYTPSTSSQTVSCSGKYMTSNITISAIPSNYLDVSKNQTIFSYGTFGAIVNQGYTLGYYYTSSGIGSTSNVPTIENYNSYYDGPVILMTLGSQGTRSGILLNNGTIDISAFSTLRCDISSIWAGSTSTGTLTFKVSVFSASKSFLKNVSHDFSGNEDTYVDLDISSINEPVFIIADGYSSYTGATRRICLRACTLRV